MKKATCFILLILLCLPLFSCVQSETTSSEVSAENSAEESVASIQIDLPAEDIQLAVGRSYKLEPVISGAPANAEVTYMSQREQVASVDKDGLIVAKREGDTQITVTVKDVSAVMKVKVVPGADEIRLNVTSVILAVGDELTLEAEALPENIIDKEVFFRSKNESVATVDEHGKITAVAKGEAVIEAYTANETTAECTVTVRPVTEVPKIAAPVVTNYVYTESGVAVLFGTCEMGAVIKGKYENTIATTNSDHGYFTLRVRTTGTNVPVEITAVVSGAESEKMTYQLVKKSPIIYEGSQYWAAIPGNDMQFHMRDYNYLDDYLRTNTFSQSQLNTIKSRINSKVASIKKVNPNAELIYMIVPSAATTYPETMPEYYTPQNRKSRLEQIHEVIEDSDAVLIDLKTAFAQHKNDPLKLYWKTDTHWTDYGAFIAYTELFNYIKTKFPEAAPRAKSEFNFVEDYYEMGDFAEYLGLRPFGQPLKLLDFFKEYNALRVPKFDMPSTISSIKRYVSDRRLTYTPGIMDQYQLTDTNRPNLPSAVILRDSYSAQIFDILAERFDKTLFRPMWDYSIRTNDLNYVDADFVIVLIVERNISSITN